jgi:hypothetical protein
LSSLALPIRDGVACHPTEVARLAVDRLDLLSRRPCGKRAPELRRHDAGRLIDTLKAARAGRIDLAVVLQEVGN